MFESYEFYRDYQYDIPTLLSINNFMKKNNVYGKMHNEIGDLLQSTTKITSN